MEKPTNEPSLWREKHLDMFVLGTFYMILKQGKRGPEFKRFKLVTPVFESLGLREEDAIGAD
jgi:hypothetical protein